MCVCECACVRECVCVCLYVCALYMLFLPSLPHLSPLSPSVPPPLAHHAREKADLRKKPVWAVLPAAETEPLFGNGEAAA